MLFIIAIAIVILIVILGSTRTPEEKYLSDIKSELEKIKLIIGGDDFMTELENIKTKYLPLMRVNIEDLVSKLDKMSKMNNNKIGYNKGMIDELTYDFDELEVKLNLLEEAQKKHSSREDERFKELNDKMYNIKNQINTVIDKIDKKIQSL